MKTYNHIQKIEKFDANGVMEIDKKYRPLYFYIRMEDKITKLEETGYTMSDLLA